MIQRDKIRTIGSCSIDRGPIFTALSAIVPNIHRPHALFIVVPGDVLREKEGIASAGGPQIPR